MSEAPIELNPEDLLIELWPPMPKTGMITGAMPTGVKVTHRPSGDSVFCDVYRSPHQNRAWSIEELARRLSERSSG